MIANLVVHHFPEKDLRSLFRLVQTATTMFLAVEPRRSALALAFSRLVWVIGGNAVYAARRPRERAGWVSRLRTLATVARATKVGAWKNVPRAYSVISSLLAGLWVSWIQRDGARRTGLGQMPTLATRRQELFFVMLGPKECGR